VSRKQVGAFDEAAATLKNAAWWCTDEGDKLGAKERLLAAQLLRVAGRVSVLKLNGQSGTDYLFDGRPDDESKIARLIHRAQTLAGKSKKGEGK
jgi:hypothetical protein